MTEPTDAEIRGLAATGNGVYQDDETAIWEITDPSLMKFARAVLAKWGQPAQAAEPVAWAATSEDGVVEALGMNQSRRFDAPLYLAPQPVAREPLEPCMDNVEGINARLHFRRGWKAAEQAHGIKGGQHGTDN